MKPGSDWPGLGCFWTARERRQSPAGPAAPELIHAADRGTMPGLSVL